MIKIIYEDNHLLVVEKPINVPTQSDKSGDPDFLTILKEDLKIRHHKPGNVYLGLVHRLDRPVGGVMVFAKTSKAAARLSAQIQERQFQKEYLAVVRGILNVKKDYLHNYLLKDHKNNTVSIVPETTLNAKQALLDYQVLAERDKLSLLRVFLHTGRSHQIRVQLAATGHPLYGDQKYGPDLNRPGQQLALYSTKLCFKHPILQEPMRFESFPLPKIPWSLFDGYLFTEKDI